MTEKETLGPICLDCSHAQRLCKCDSAPTLEVDDTIKPDKNVESCPKPSIHQLLKMLEEGAKILHSDGSVFGGFHRSTWLLKDDPETARLPHVIRIEDLALENVVPLDEGIRVAECCGTCVHWVRRAALFTKGNCRFIQDWQYGKGRRRITDTCSKYTWNEKEE